MVGRAGFEPAKAMPSDLQSDLVDRLSTDPNAENSEYEGYSIETMSKSQ